MKSFIHSKEKWMAPRVPWKKNCRIKSPRKKDPSKKGPMEKKSRDKSSREKKVPKKTFCVKGMPGKCTEGSCKIFKFLLIDPPPPPPPHTHTRTHAHTHHKMLNAHPTIPYPKLWEMRACRLFSGDLFPQEFFPGALFPGIFSTAPFFGKFFSRIPAKVRQSCCKPCQNQRKSANSNDRQFWIQVTLKLEF